MTVDTTARDPAEEKFRLAVEACPDGMVTIGRDGKIVMVNAAVEQQFGYRREELIGRAISQLAPVARTRKSIWRRWKANIAGCLRQLRTRWWW